jgi:thiamine pyrophosphokinase
MESTEYFVWPINEIVSDHSQGMVDIAPLLAACIVLNVPQIPTSILMHIFTRFQYKICADGGANVLYDTIPGLHSDTSNSVFLPNAIVGDLDSIRPEVKNFFFEHGVSVIKFDSQENTDLDKALLHVQEISPTTEPRFVVISGSIGSYEGRIDQFFAVLNSMYSYLNSSLRLISVGDKSIMIVLPAGKHELNLPPAAKHQHCGLLPAFGQVDEVVTTGFRWNLSKDMGPLKYGLLVSTSNIVDDVHMTVETSHPLLYTLTYR